MRIYALSARVLAGTLIALIVFVLSAPISSPLLAATKTFTATGTNDLFSNRQRWNNGSLPGSGDTLTIIGTCTFDNAAANLSYGSLTLGDDFPSTKDGAIVWPAGGTNTLRVGSISGLSHGHSTIDMTSGGTLQISGTWSANSNTTFLPGAGTVVFTGNTTLPSSIATYNNLSSGGTVTLASSATVNGNFQVTSGSFRLWFGGRLTANGSATNSGAISLGTGALIAKGTFTNAGSISETLGGPSLTLAGNFINNGTLDLPTCPVTLNGTGPQTLGGSAALAFDDLIINNAAGITLGRNLTVNGALTLTSGKIDTGANRLVLASGAGVTGGGPSNYVIGNLQKHISSGSPAASFEVGTAAAYEPISATFTGVSSGGDLTATVLTGDHPNLASSTLAPNRSANLHWSLTNSGTAFASCALTFNFTAGDLDAGADPAAFLLGQYNGSTWTYPSVTGRSPTSLQTAGLTSLGEFAVADNSEVYTLTLTQAPHGLLTKTPDLPSYAPGASVQLAAAPDPGYTLSGWSGDLTGSANPATVTMNSSKNITATFTQNAYQLNVSVTGSGSVSQEPRPGQLQLRGPGHPHCHTRRRLVLLRLVGRPHRQR